MKAFVVDFSTFVIAADEPDALGMVDELRRLCRERDNFDPGTASIKEASEQDVSRFPELQAKLERFTALRYGPEATGEERELARREIAAAAGDDVALKILADIERRCGYLPQTWALQTAAPYTGLGAAAA